MARQKLKPKRPQQSVVVNADDLNDEDYVPPDFEFHEKRDELIGSGGGTIRVYREGPGGYRDLTFVKGFGLNEFEPEMLQQEPFGGGRFRIHMRGETGIKDNFLFKVEPLPGVRRAVDQSGTTVSVSNDSAALVAAMQAGFAQLVEKLKPAAPVLGIKEILDIVSIINKPAAVPANGGLGQLKQLAEFMEVIESARLPTGKDGEVSIWGVAARAFDKIAEPLGAVLSEVAKRKLNGAESVPALPAPAAAAAPQVKSEDEMLVLLKSYLPLLIANAAADNDPATYANMILDAVAPEVLRAYVDRPDWFEVLAPLDPRLATHKEWFTELRECIMEGLTAQPEASINREVAPPASESRPDAPSIDAGTKHNQNS